MNAPGIMPKKIEPRPPSKLTPPTTTTASAVNSRPLTKERADRAVLDGSEDTADRGERARKYEAEETRTINGQPDFPRDGHVVADGHYLASEGSFRLQKVHEN